MKFYFRRPHVSETKHRNSFMIVLASFTHLFHSRRPIEKYPNEAEITVVFYFSFISQCATGFKALVQSFASYLLLAV